MRYIERIRISGFKSIRDIVYKETREANDRGLPLRDLNVLIGANGTGKSNFLSFFDLLRTIVEDEDTQKEEYYEPIFELDPLEEARGKLRNYTERAGGAYHLAYFGTTVTREVAADIWFWEDSAPQPILSYEIRLAPASGDSLIFDEDTTRHMSPNPHGFGDQPPSLSHTRRGGGALFDGQHDSDWVRERFARMAPIRVYHFPDAGDATPARRISDLDDNRYLRSEGENLAPLLYLIKTKHPSSYRDIVNVVTLVFPFFEDFQLAPRQLNESQIRLEWKESGEDSYRDASYLSDGTLRFMCLATLLLQPKPPGLILIDEPELGLHPYAIGVLADLLKAASDKSQLIVSTQSVTLVNQLGPQDIIVVERQKEPESARYETVFKRLQKADLERWLEDYGMGDLWEKNLIGGRP